MKSCSEFERQCLPFRTELFAMAMKVARNRAAADDLVQETFLRALVAWDSFQQGTNLRGWLFRILINARINDYRKDRRRRELAGEYPGDVLIALYGRAQDCASSASVAALDATLSDEVHAALARLGSEHREVIERADLRGEKYRDIADALRVPIGTVMSRLCRARRALKGALLGLARERGLKAA